MTKKFLISYCEKGIRKTKKNEFLVPNVNKDDDIFIGLATGKKCQYGLVIYTGVDLTKTIVIDKMIENNLISTSDSKIDQIIADYLIFLKSCKIGDIVELNTVDGLYNFKITGLRSNEEVSKIP